jgi:hypothetical protein
MLSESDLAGGNKSLIQNKPNWAGGNKSASWEWPGEIRALFSLQAILDEDAGGNRSLIRMRASSLGEIGAILASKAGEIGAIFALFLLLSPFYYAA